MGGLLESLGGHAMKVKNSADFLDDLQKKLGVESDYAVGKALDIHRQQLSHYRLLKGAFDDAMCVRVAEVLGLDSAYVMACMHCQRAKQPEVKKTWERLATLSMGVTAALLVALLVPFTSADDMQYGLMAVTEFGTTVYYVKSASALYWPAFLALFIALATAFPWQYAAPKNYSDTLSK